LNGVSGGSLTRGRAGAGVLGHLVLVIRIFGIRNSAVWADLDPGVLAVLKAELLQRGKEFMLEISAAVIVAGI
jgi:hypothetical protein